MTYSIGISSGPESEIRSDYKQTMGRKKRILVLPSSVPFNEAGYPAAFEKAHKMMRPVFVLFAS